MSSTVCFLLKGSSMRELRTENNFYIQISIELKIKCARFVLDGFAWFTIHQRENFLGYLVIFFFFCSYVNPFVSYDCFYRTRSIVRNRYYCVQIHPMILSMYWLTLLDIATRLWWSDKKRWQLLLVYKNSNVMYWEKLLFNSVPVQTHHNYAHQI